MQCEDSIRDTDLHSSGAIGLAAENKVDKQWWEEFACFYSFISVMMIKRT